jgi:hypothetical protein
MVRSDYELRDCDKGDFMFRDGCVSNFLPAAILLILGAWVIPELLSGEVMKGRTVQSSSVTSSVRELVSQGDENDTAVSKLFMIGDEGIPSLIELLRSPDKDIKRNAAKALAYIGNHQGLAALRSAIGSEADVETKSAFYYFLAGGLVRAKSKADVDLLASFVREASASKDSADVVENAPAVTSALALAMRGTTDALPTLRMFVKLGLVGSEEVSEAVVWIESNATAKAQARASESNKVMKLDDRAQVEETILHNTFFAESKRDQVSFPLVQFNSSETKVLVSLELSPGAREHRSYDLVLSKEDGKWSVTGIWFSGIA